MAKLAEFVVGSLVGERQSRKMRGGRSWKKKKNRISGELYASKEE